MFCKKRYVHVCIVVLFEICIFLFFHWVIGLIIPCIGLIFYKGQTCFYLYSPPSFRRAKSIKKLYGKRGIYFTNPFSRSSFYPIDEYDKNKTKNMINVIYFHGNACDVVSCNHIGHYLKNIRCDIRVFMVEYRGYCLNRGIPHENGIVNDCINIVCYIRNIYKGPVVLYGSSLGGAIVLHVASKMSSLKGIIIQNTFTNLYSMMKNQLSKRWQFLWNFCSERWDNLLCVKNLTLPVLFIVSEKDVLIPQSMMGQLYDNYGCKNKNYKTFPCGHNTLYSDGNRDAVLDKIKSFINGIVDIQKCDDYPPNYKKKKRKRKKKKKMRKKKIKIK